MLLRVAYVCLCLAAEWCEPGIQEPMETPQPLFLSELPIDLLQRLVYPNPSRVYELHNRHVRWWEYLYERGYCTLAEHDAALKCYDPVFALSWSVGRVWSPRQRYSNLLEGVWNCATTRP